MTRLLLILALLGLPALAEAQYAHVQSRFGGAFPSGTGVPFTSNVTSGNKLIICAAYGHANATTYPTISDTRSTSYGTPVEVHSDGGTAVACWFGAVASSGANTVTLTMTGKTFDLAIHEYSGIELVDVHSSAHATGGVPSSGTMGSTAWVTEMIFGFASHNSAAPTPDGAFTGRVNNAFNYYIGSEDRRVTAGGTYAALYGTTTADWNVIGIAFKETGSAAVGGGGGGTGGGGIRELSTDQVVRPIITGVEAGVPTLRGPFTFATPYGTQGYRITDATDCTAGADCVSGGTYAYWPMVNNSSSSATTAYVVAHLRKAQGGGGATLYSINKSTKAVTKVGALFAGTDPWSNETGEGWYFSRNNASPSMYYLFSQAANSTGGMYRHDILSHATTQMFSITAAAAVTAFGSGRYVWQPNSDRTDTTHSFTIRSSSTGAMLGCGVYFEAGNAAGRTANSFKYYPAVLGPGWIDECEVDASGLYLQILEDIDGSACPTAPTCQEDSRYIRLSDDNEVRLYDPQGSAGHYATGWGYIIARDDWWSYPASRLWNLNTGPTPGPGTVVQRDLSWETGGSGNHPSWNHSDNSAIGSQFVCTSSAETVNHARTNEIYCYKTDGTTDVIVVAPNMISLTTGSGGGSYYTNLPKASTSPDGKYIAWLSNLGTSRNEIIVAEIPSFTAPVVTTHLTLAAAVVNNNSGTSAPTAWTLSATGPTPISGAGGVSSDVTAGTYVLAYTSVSGYTASAWICTAGTLTGSSLVLASGQSATCTVTFDDIAPTTATLTVITHIINDSGRAGTASQWTILVSATSPSTATFAGSESPGTTLTMGPGSYSVSQTGGPVGYVLASAVGCSGTATAGTAYTCTLVNNDLTTDSDTGSGGPPATPTVPAVSLNGNRVVLGTAELWSGTGNPAEVITAPIGSTWYRADIGRLFVKTGIGTTGWAEAYQQGGSDVAVTDGGTGRSDWSPGQLVYAPAVDVLSGLAPVPFGQVLASMGSTVPPAYTSDPKIMSVGQQQYVSQLTGWNISPAGGADFRYIYADELHAKAFIADLEQALAGGQIISKSVGILYSDFICPAAGGTGSLVVEDLPGAAAMQIFDTNDWVMIRSFTRAAQSLTVADCVGQVSAPVTTANGYQTWTFTRGTGGNSGILFAGVPILKGTVVLDFGTSGNGYYEVNAVDGVDAENSPYARIATWATSPVSGNRTLRSQFGNLRGVTGVAGEFGLIAGTYATGVTGQYVRASSQAVELHGVDFQIFDTGVSSGTVPVFRIERNANAPYMAIGGPAPTSFSSGTGCWMGDDAGVYKFRCGIPGGDRFEFDGTNVTISGRLTIGTGSNWLSNTEFRNESSVPFGTSTGSTPGTTGPQTGIPGNRPSGIGGENRYWTANYYSGSGSPVWNWVCNGVAYPGGGGCSVQELAGGGVPSAGSIKQIIGPAMAATQGQYYEFSFYTVTGTPLSSVCGLIAFFNASGTLISAVGNTTCSTTNPGGTAALSTWNRVWAYGVAPANTAWALPYIEATYGGTDANSNVYLVRVFFGEAGPGQTSPRLWNPGGVTIVDGRHLSTDMVISNTIRSSAATALNTGTGFWLDATGTPTFRVGNPSADYLKWDGSNLIMTSSFLSVSTAGIKLTPDDGSGGFAPARVYAWTSSTGSGNLHGLWGYDGTALGRGMELQNAWSGACSGSRCRAQINITASNSTGSYVGSAGVFLYNDASTTYMDLTSNANGLGLGDINLYGVLDFQNGGTAVGGGTTVVTGCTVAGYITVKYQGTSIKLPFC